MLSSFFPECWEFCVPSWAFECWCVGPEWVAILPFWPRSPYRRWLGVNGPEVRLGRTWKQSCERKEQGLMGIRSEESADRSNLEEELAERGGFEPPLRLLTVNRFSKPAPSATRPPLRWRQMRSCAPSQGQVFTLNFTPNLLPSRACTLPRPHRASAHQPRVCNPRRRLEIRNVLKERRMRPIEDQSSMVAARRNASRSGMPPAARDARANTSPVSPARAES